MSQRLLSRTWRPLARNTSTLRTCPPKTHYHKQSSRVSRSLAKPLGIGCVVLGAGFTTFTAYQRNGTSGLFRNASAQSLDDMEDFSADADGGPFQQLGGPLIVDENTDLIALHSQMHKDDDCVTHACALASNSPREDFMTAGSFEARKTGVTDWRYWEIFDGHAGSQTARALESLLHVVVVGEISDPEHKDSSVADSIKRAFVRLDEVFLSSAKDALAITPATSRETAAVDVALAGSCALASFYDVAKSTLYVANTGDSRAVLGRYSSLSGSYAPQPLSFDHTGFNESEVKRIEAQHPGETGIIDPKTGRIFGLAVVRAFGDTRWKWDDDTVMEAHKKFWGPKPRPNGVIKTPPYLTAEPEVTETEVVKGRNGDFVIMASDGLWDHLSSEQAVTIVEQWREMKKKGMLGKENYSIPEDEDTYYDERPGYGLTWRQKPEYFCYQDENVAACLVRNAMGGKRKHLVDRVTKMEPPLSRDAHDDVSVQRMAQKTLDGPIDAAYMGNLTAQVKYITDRGAYALIAPHNYGRYYNNVITNPSAFKTFWANLAKPFAGNSRVIFDTDNEFHDMSQTLVVQLNQAAIDGIRSSGATQQYITPEGNAWSGAWSWTSRPDPTTGLTNGQTMGGLKDPSNKLIYQMHQYLDSDSSGTSEVCVNSTILLNRLQDATNWLRTNKKKGIIGEFAGGNNANCIAALKGGLTFLTQNTDVWTGALWWAAGPWWGTYLFNAEPTSGSAIYNQVLPQLEAVVLNK